MTLTVKSLRNQILADLSGGSRSYEKITDKLRNFIQEHVPEAEIVREGSVEVIRLRKTK